MKSNKIKRLFLLFTVMFILACRMGGCQYTDTNTSDGLNVRCTWAVEAELGLVNGYRCSVFCPDDNQYHYIYIFGYDVSEYTREELEAMSCSGEEVPPAGIQSAPTEAPIVTEEPVVTEEPTEPPTEPPAAVMPSIMGGKVSYCAEVQGQKYLNLPFNSGADPALVQTKLGNGELTVQVGNVNGNCRVDAPNELLVCAFPAGTFPTFSSTAPNSIINVADNGTIIDVIQFNNSCEAEQKQTSGGSGDTGDTGSTGGGPVCDATDPGTPCYCALYPDDDSCSP